jgi:preprotein translocase subunit SecY
MLSDLFKSISFILSVANLALAADITDISSDGLGCIATIASSSIGFNANFYSYSLTDSINFNDNNWIANSFTDYCLSASATGVTDPIFSFPAVSATDVSLYGLQSINLRDTALELTGYFIGMYIYSILIFLFSYFYLFFLE